MWSVVAALRGKSKSSANTKCGYILDDKYLNIQETVVKLNEYFSTVGGKPSEIDLSNQISLLTEHELFVHPGQVKTWLKQIDCRKSTCSQDFPPWVSKLCADDLCLPLCNVINSSLRRGIYPDIWKAAEVVPLEKVKSVKALSDFRPISLLWNLGKILEKAIMHFYAKAVIPGINQNQFAYQKGKCTTDAVASAVDKWTELLDVPKVKSLPTAFLDMSKAFDRMCHTRLLSMMVERDVNKRIVLIVDSFLSNRQQLVRMGKARSDLRPVLNGTPQGTLLGPMFWLLYIDTLMVGTHVIKYADDVTLTPGAACSDSLASLQVGVNETAKWCTEHNMIVNASKSVVVTLSNIHVRKKSEIPSPQLTLNSEVIPCKPAAKFLGVVIDEHLSFAAHIDNIIAKIRPLIYTILDLKRSGVPVALLKSFYITSVRPIVLYACPAWYTMVSCEQADRLAKIERLVLKIIFPAMEAYDDRLTAAGIPSVLAVMEGQCQAYIMKVQTPNHCLHHLLPPVQSAICRHSNRVRDRYVVKSRTALRRRSPLVKYLY